MRSTFMESFCVLKSGGGVQRIRAAPCESGRCGKNPPLVVGPFDYFLYQIIRNL